MKKMVFLCMGVAAFVLMAHAALAGEIVLLFQNGPNQASDVDRLYLIDRVRNVDNAGNPLPADSPPTVGQIDIGDSLRGSINFNTLNSASANVGGSTGNNELSGVFQFLITRKANVGGGDPPDQWVYTFGPDPSFTALYGPGAMVAAYEDPSPDYTADFDDPAPATPPSGPDDGTAARTVPPSSSDVSVGPYATEEAFIATAVDGTWRMTLGFLGLPGEGANAQGISEAGDSILQSFGVTSGSTFISVNLGLNLLAMDPAWAAALTVNRVTASAFGGGVDFAGSQQIMGVSDLDTPFEASSNTTISFDVQLASNQPPTAICQDLTVVADANCTADAVIDNGSFDPDGDAVTLAQSPPGPYPLGSTLVTLTVTDIEGASSQCTGTVTVVDETPPTITGVSVSPNLLWPPNHKMVPATVRISTSDNCDPGAVCKIVSVSSNEPVNGLGDGDTAPDWLITGDLTVNLRAERSGKGNGRIYTVTFECTDASGNSATGTTTVAVPHDQGNSKKVVVPDEQGNNNNNSNSNNNKNKNKDKNKNK